MILHAQLSEGYNSIEIKIPVIKRIGVKVEIFLPKKITCSMVVQVVLANLKLPLHPLNSAYKSRGSSGHWSYLVAEAKCYRNSETRSISAPPDNDINP